jgi:proline dehydrogenase
MVTLDQLGERVTTLAGADRATREYIDLLDRMLSAGVDRNISIKLTQLGLALDGAVCMDNVRRLLDAAGAHGFFVRIDMEDSLYTQQTLDLFETLWQQGYHHAGIVLQAALHRSERDLERMNALGARVRLVKGAYKEPKAVAYQKMSEIYAAFRRMTTSALLNGTYPAIATHDPVLLDEARALARDRRIGSDRFEVQMLYGVRRDLQRAYLAAGCRMRIYVPFGTQWFPYFMRRLGERPANVMFVLRAILTERSAS